MKEYVRENKLIEEKIEDKIDIEKESEDEYEFEKEFEKDFEDELENECKDELENDETIEIEARSKLKDISDNEEISIIEDKFNNEYISKLKEELEEDETHLMKIGEIAAFFNVSTKAIRLYEKKGIIRPVKVDAQSGYRYYSVAQVQQLNALIELKSLGFSLDEIKAIMEGNITSEKLVRALERKKQAWLEMIYSAQYKMEAINGINKRLLSSKQAKELHKLTDDERAWLLVKMVCVEEVHTQSTLSEALWL